MNQTDETACSGILRLQQKSRNHSDKDGGSYPHMLLEHVEGSGSRHGLSELQGLPLTPRSNDSERCIVDPADIGKPARERQEQQHRAKHRADGDPRRRAEQ